MAGFGVLIAARKQLQRQMSQRQPSLMQSLGLSNAKSYGARLYYSNSGIHSWEVYFVIILDLELHVAVSVSKDIITSYSD